MDRVRLDRAPHVKYKYLLGSGGQSMDRALEHFCCFVKETGSPSVRAVAQEREFICGALRISRAPYAPSGKGLPLR